MDLLLIQVSLRYSSKGWDAIMGLRGRELGCQGAVCADSTWNRDALQIIVRRRPWTRRAGCPIIVAEGWFETSGRPRTQRSRSRYDWKRPCHGANTY